MRTVAFVEARLQSDRLPGKHMMDVGGHPLAWWPIEAALATQEIDQVVITTNDADVREMAHDMGCVPLDRPDDLYEENMSGDELTRQLYQLYTHWCFEHFGNEEDFVCVRLHGNTAIFDDNLLENLLHAREENDADQARPVARCFRHPYSSMRMFPGKQPTATVEWPGLYAMDSKEYPVFYSDLEIGDVQVIPRLTSRKTAKPFAVYLSHPFAAMHVHDHEDIEMARELFKLRVRNI